MIISLHWHFYDATKKCNAFPPGRKKWLVPAKGSKNRQLFPLFLRRHFSETVIGGINKGQDFCNGLVQFNRYFFIDL